MFHVERFFIAAFITFLYSVGSLGPASAASQTLLSRFSQPFGLGPTSNVIADPGGVLYGELGTAGPGGGNCYRGYGCGTIYKAVPPKGSQATWVTKDIYAFDNGLQGGTPTGGLLRTEDGALYGVTNTGGDTSCGCGTVFRLVPPPQGIGSWTLQTLFRFAGADTGARPVGGLVSDPSGNLYGTTTGGGDPSCEGGCGLVFKLSPASQKGAAWSQTVLYRFKGLEDGSSPRNAMILNDAGYLYGVTRPAQSTGSQIATAFLLAPQKAAGKYTFRVIHKFDFAFSTVSGPLSFGKGGAIFGGASYRSCTFSKNMPPCGEVFQLNPPANGANTWSFRTLYVFKNINDGEYPGYLGLQKDGSIIGTTEYNGYNGQGTIFRLTPAADRTAMWSKTLLHTVTQPDGNGHGSLRYGTLASDNGRFFGTLVSDNTHPGALIEMTP